MSASPKVLTPEIRRAIHHILWVWFQYDGKPENRKDGMVCLEHRNMSAGESAAEFLESYGVATDQGYEIKLTPLGMEIFEEDGE